MTRKQKYLLVGVLFLLTAAVVVFFLFLNNPKSALSDQQIKEKFACNRMTLEYRETDVFCSKPELYRNPDMSEAEYTAWQRSSCPERLKNPLTSEQRTNDPAMAKAYDDCVNKPSLHDEYVTFIQNIKRLREAN